MYVHIFQLCGAITTVHYGGGFRFHLLRCDKCGDDKTIGFEVLGEIHARYQQGAPREEYYYEVEGFSDKCNCGGIFTFNAPPRCRKCRSTRMEEGKPYEWYD